MEKDLDESTMEIDYVQQEQAQSTQEQQALDYSMSFAQRTDEESKVA